MSYSIIAVDPGLDDTGFAVFDYAEFVERGATPQDAILAVKETGTICTSPGDDLGQRIHDLCQHLHHVCLFHNVVWGIVEYPAIPGTYGRGGATRASLNALYTATGAIIATLTSTMPVKVQEATTKPKQQRHDDLVLCHATIHEDLRPPLPAGPRGGKREDEMDAMHLGWWALMQGHPGR